MALVNHAKKEINAKLVYYGPSGSGKGSALQYIYSRIKPSLRGELKNVSAGGDTLLFFDFSPFEMPLADGYRLRLHVYTLIGQVTNPAAWKMTLKGADGLVIMVDPSADRLADARESVAELRDFLSAYGVGLQDIPAVLQINYSETETAVGDASQIALALDLPHLTPSRSSVISGEGVLDVLSTLAKLVLERVIETEKRTQSPGDADSSADADFAELEEPLESVENSHNVPVAELPAQVDSASDVDKIFRISIAPEDVGAEGTVLRIPIDISCGDTCRRLVITVSADLL